MKKQQQISKDTLRDWVTTKEEPYTPEAEQKVNDTERALIIYAAAYAQTPAPALREKILGKISRLNQQKIQRQSLDIQQLPLLDASSNWLDWQELVSGIEAPKGYEDIHLHPLESNKVRDLFVVWAKEDVGEEIHYDLLESFLILEGSCECRITDEAGQKRIVHLREGDFLTIGIGEMHDLRITSLLPAKAIVQKLNLAS